MTPRILVIGSANHRRAECVDWLQPFPNIEEYDSVIINLQSLSQKQYDEIYKKVRRMRDSISTIFNTNREVFCIMNALMFPSPSSITERPKTPHYKVISPGYTSSTNYDWLPTRIEVSLEKSGTSIEICDKRFENYFQLIDRWVFEIYLSPRTFGEMIRDWNCSIRPIAINKSQKAIAGSLMHTTLDGEVVKGKEKCAIHLLPPPSKSSDSHAIEAILDLILGGSATLVQPWRKNIEVPEEKELEAEIDQKVKEIRRVQEEISQLRSRIQEWDSYRDLFTTTGDALENVIQKTLRDLGIKTEKTEMGFPADLISKEFAVEITGIKGCVGSGSEKVNQVGRFRETYRKEEKIVVIANTYSDLSPRDREGKQNFSQEVIKYFESLSVCCLSTMTLFQLWKDVVAQKRDIKNIRNKILCRNGELTLDEFK